ncbi:aminoacyl-tRNA hydrolase [Naumannella halotolerans]|uniref:Peptidyl-tRNA hydrolase n=1 Tax=Naumannella halotolerans TaxID=993414 RepID=A0A4R7J839_9ACTN|nr:aminoacyl-tRNA hydrolase [Naumannella halotolerans]TDT32529.1 PTH1 family peptidyl-tRNA hydrolase [Naumannella halotolerans]
MSSSAPWLVVGLGNPGPGYAGNRHNVGFFVADALASRAGVKFTAPRGMRAEVAETRLTAAGIGGIGTPAQRLVLVKPRTYMNDSGLAVRKLAAFHKVPAEQVIVIHDELDLDLGRIRVKLGGGDNGHNGLKSIRAHLGTGDFPRIRFGIGRPPGRMEVQAWVLSDFRPADRAEVELQTENCADAVEVLVNDGLSAAQNRFNS